MNIHGVGVNQYGMDVNSRGMALVDSVSKDLVLDATFNGNAYNINTGLITSYGADGTLIYFKNGNTKDFIFESLAIGIFGGITYNANSFPYVTIVTNPTGGDLISDATAVGAKVNRNAGSSNQTLPTESLAYRGKAGGTLTGGNDLGYFLLNATGRSFFGVNLVIPQGKDVGVKLNMNITSGSATIYGAIIGSFKEEGL